MLCSSYLFRHACEGQHGGFIGSNARWERALNTRDWLLLAVASMPLGLVSQANAQAPPLSSVQVDAPNIVLIVVDDLGRAELGGYGQRLLRTPNLDALATRSALFTDAYATAPVCAPSRCSIMTGMHAGHCAVDENFEPNIPLESRDPTIAELLGSVGYHGVMVGKWALGGELDDGTPWDVQSAPWRVGFTDVFAALDQSLAQDHFPEWLWRAQGGEPQREMLFGNEQGGRIRYAPDLFADDAARAVRETPEPFFLYLAPTLPHRELVVPEPLTPTENWSLQDATYAAMIERLDRHVGMIMEEIEARGIGGRTILVFTSDNGPNAIDGHAIDTFQSSGVLRGRKRDLYEGGIRVPLFIAGLGITTRTVTTPVSLADLLPTFTELARAPQPRVDGRSFSHLLSGQDAPVHESLFFACREAGSGSELPTRDAVRRGDWKWIRRADGVEELFHLATDPGETSDVAALHPDVVTALREIAARALAPRPRVKSPVLHVQVGGGESAPPSASVQAILQLRADALSEDGSSWTQSLSAPRITSTLVDATRDELGDVPCVRFSRSRTSHVVIPAHPALALGGRNFSLHARLQLDALAEGPTRDARQWLVLAKPMGTHDGYAALGVLVQSGDFCTHTESTTCNGREIALLFGDPSLDDGHPFVVLTNTRIEDDQTHDLEVRVMRDRGLIQVRLDDQVELIPVLFPARAVDSEAPWILGAHHGASGRFAQGMSGALFEFDVLAGADESASLEDALEAAQGSTLVVDLGARDAGAITETLTLKSPSRNAHWFRVAIDAEASPAIQLGDDRLLMLPGTEYEVAFTWRPSGEGLVEDEIRIEATRGRSGELVAGTPLRILLRAHRAVPEDPTQPHGLARGLGLGVLLPSLITMLIASRKRR